MVDISWLSLLKKHEMFGGVSQPKGSLKFSLEHSLAAL